MKQEITKEDLERLSMEIELSATIPENEVEVGNEFQEAWELSHPKEV